MGKIATKKATRQLQKIYEYVGATGGQIHTYVPESWWPLSLEIFDAEEGKKGIAISVFKQINGDIIFDPQFTLLATMEDDKIVEAEICSYEEDYVYGSMYIDENDMIGGFGVKQKDEYGLKRRFSKFMENMAVNGPYLTEPKSLTKYQKPGK